MFTMEQRRATYAKLYREQLSRMTPNCDGNRFSGSQIAAAKGVARRRFFELERSLSAK